MEEGPHEPRSPPPHGANLPPASLLRMYKRWAAAATRRDFLGEDLTQRIAQLKGRTSDEASGSRSGDFDSAEVSSEKCESEGESLGEFVHLTVLSANNLSSLLSFGDLEGGYGETALEEDLELTLGQLLTSPDCQFTLIAGEEGVGKTVALRRIVHEFDRILTPSAGEPLVACFPIYINCSRLVSRLLLRYAGEEASANALDPIELLALSAAQSLPSTCYSATCSSSSSSPASTTVGRQLLEELLRETRYSFVLLLDGLDTLPRDLANELLFIMLGQKDANENIATDSTAISALQEFGRRLANVFGRRLQRVIACCRVETLADLVRYPMRPAQTPSIGAATNPSTGSIVAGGEGEAEGESEGEGSSNAKQWRIMKLSSLCGETEQRLFIKTLFQRFGLMELQSASTLLDSLLERKGYVLPVQKHNPLMLTLLLQNLLATVGDESQASAANNFSQLLSRFIDALITMSQRNPKEEDKDLLLRDMISRPNDRVREEERDIVKEELDERRKLIGVLAFLTAWWEDSYGKRYHFVHNPLFSTDTEGDTAASQRRTSDIFVAQRHVFADAMGLYYQLRKGVLGDEPGDQRRQRGERLLSEVESMLPEMILQRGIGETLAFTNSAIHQYLIADYLLACMANLEDEIIFTKITGNVLQQWEAARQPWQLLLRAPRQSNETTHDNNESASGGKTLGSVPLHEASTTTSNSGGGEKRDFLRYFWTDEWHLAEKWWAEVILFISFSKGTHWLAEKILAPKHPSLKEWFDSLKGHDPQDLGQLRFSHLLRSKACEGMLKLKGRTDTEGRAAKPLKKKTKWGGAFLEFLDKSDSALLHLDYYPVYLQLNYVLGTKVVEVLIGKCIDVFKGPNSAYAIDLMVKFYQGGVLNEKNINSVINNLLEDDEPRVRKAALDLLWRLALLHKTNNSIFPPHIDRTKLDPTRMSAEASDNPRRANRGRASSGDKKEDPLSFVRVIQIVSIKLKDKHTLVQQTAAGVMKEMAQLSVASLDIRQQSFLFKRLLSEDAINFRQLVNSAVKMMQTFDVYVWLLRWLGHEDPGLRLLVLIVLGLLANPLLPTKQKFDPSRKAICLVLTSLSQEYTPTDPHLNDILREISARRKKKSSASSLLSSLGSSSDSNAGDNMDPLLVPFVTVLFEALGETAVRCEDLSMMLDLVKCKPFFLKKLCLLILERIDAEKRRTRLDSLLNSFNQRDETNALLDFYVKQEVIQLLQEIDTDIWGKARAELSYISEEEAQTNLTDIDCKSVFPGDRTLASDALGSAHDKLASLYATFKLELVSSWLTQRSQADAPAQTEAGRKCDNAANGTDSNDRELRLQMVDAIPSVLHLNDINALRYLKLLIRLVLTEEDHITAQTLISKLQNLASNAIMYKRRHAPEDMVALNNVRSEVEDECFAMMENRNAYMVLTAIRLISLLDRSRDMQHDHTGAAYTSARHETTTDEQGRNALRRQRLQQVIHRTMALLSHREADARHEALDLLRMFVDSVLLDLDDNLLVLCSMLKNRIYFVRATAVSALGTIVQHFLSRSDGMEILRRVEIAVVSVLTTSTDDKAVIESAVRTLGFFGSMISDESLALVGSLLKEPSRLRATVIETIGASGEKGIAYIPNIAELLLVEDNWLRTIAVTQLSKLALLRPLSDAHLQGIAALLRYEEYYVKESAIQILCALGVDTLLHFMDDIIRIMDDEEDEEEPCVVIMTLYALSLVFAHYRQYGHKYPDPLNLCSNYLSHVLAKLDDNSVPVKKAAIKAIRQYPQMIANHSFALQRLTRFLNTFAEESQVQLQAFILLGEANRLSVFDHLSPLLSLLHCRDTKILMKTITALGNLGANCVHLIPSAINRTKSHEMRRRLLSLLIKFIGYGNFDILCPPPPPLLGSGGYGREAEKRDDRETGGDARDDHFDQSAAKKRKEIEYEEKEIEYLFKNKDSSIKRQAFRMMANYYLYSIAQHLIGGRQHRGDTSHTTEVKAQQQKEQQQQQQKKKKLNSTTDEKPTSKTPPVMTLMMATAMGATPAQRGGSKRESQTSSSDRSTGREESTDDMDFSLESDDDEASSGGDSLLAPKYRKFLVAMLKDKNPKSRMEAVLALGQLLHREHREIMLRLIFPQSSNHPGTALSRSLINSVAVWRLLSHQWHTLIAVPTTAPK